MVEFLGDVLYDLKEFSDTRFEVVALFRMIVASICGGLIGLEREMKGRPAGLKTFSLVCVGATLAMITNEYISRNFGGSGDLARMAAQVHERIRGGRKNPGLRPSTGQKYPDHRNDGERICRGRPGGPKRGNGRTHCQTHRSDEAVSGAEGENGRGGLMEYGMEKARYPLMGDAALLAFYGGVEL